MSDDLAEVLEDEVHRLIEIQRVVNQRLLLAVDALAERNIYRRERLISELRETERTLHETIMERYPSLGRS